MNEPVNHIDVTCEKCSKQFPVEVRGLDYEVDQRCPNCGYRFLVQDTTRKAFMKSMFQEYEKVGGK